MAAIAEQHKRNNMDLQKQLQDPNQSQPPARPDSTHHLQALQEKDRWEEHHNNRSTAQLLDSKPTYYVVNM